MALVINTNIASLIASNNVGSTAGSLQKDISHLSSGLRIATAADDASGLAISENLKSATAAYQQAARNANDGVSALQTAEGGLSQVSNILVRMKELATEAANGTTTDTKSLQSEFSQLQSEITRIAGATTFNGSNLLDGSFSKSLQVGPKSSDTLALGLTNVNLGSLSTLATTASSVGATVAASGNSSTAGAVTSGGTYTGTADATYTVKITGGGSETTATFQYSTDGGTTWNGSDITATGITANALSNGVTATFGAGTYVAGDSFTIAATGTSVNLGSQAGASGAMGKIDANINSVSGFRGTVGSLQNRLGYTVANLQTMAQNTQASESQITDEDFATGMADFTKHQVLQQAGVAILSQANSLTQSVLKLVG